MTKVVERDAQGGDSPAFEITPEMIEAGVHELRNARFGQALDEIAESIYLAMHLEHRP